MNDQGKRRTAFPLGVVFSVSGDVKTVVHLIRENSHSHYMPTFGLTDLGPVMGTTHDLCIMELNPNVELFLLLHRFLAYILHLSQHLRVDLI